ncbi:hypothetical protein HOB87_08215 [Candidatus Woesearchaeota archaeon]|jgi:nitroreductase|nr:hypothetical protein [Candidatus Woesearchaeota archaeon]MBT7557983.1 hypothetical protein [Candidatus Woesearchaeota archaeon]
MNNFINLSCSKLNSLVSEDDSYLKPASLVKNPNPEMPLIDAICTRRTARTYSKKLVPYDVFSWIVKMSLNASSACNEQNWKIICIDDRKIIDELYHRGSASFLKKTNQCFFVCYNNESDNTEWDDDVQSGAAFVSTFSLIAHTVGVGTCWVGHLPNRSEIKRMFSMHSNYKPIALVSYGYYSSGVKMKPRKRSSQDVIFMNSFDSSSLNFRDKKKIRFRHFLRYVYYKTPFFIRKYLKKYTTKYEKKFYYESFD